MPAYSTRSGFLLTWILSRGQRSSKDYHCCFRMWRKCLKSKLTLHWCSASVVLSSCNFFLNLLILSILSFLFSLMVENWNILHCWLVSVISVSHVISISFHAPNIINCTQWYSCWFGNLLVAHILHVVKFAACVWTLKICYSWVGFRCDSHSCAFLLDAEMWCLCMRSPLIRHCGYDIYIFW